MNNIKKITTLLIIIALIVSYTALPIDAEAKTIKEFDAVVEKIQSKDFSGRAKDKNLCANCDMRHYCRRKGDC